MVAELAYGARARADVGRDTRPTTHSTPTYTNICLLALPQHTALITTSISFHLAVEEVRRKGAGVERGGVQHNGEGHC